MAVTRLLATTLFAAVAMAATLPELASRQSSSTICGSQPQVPVSDIGTIAIYSGSSFMGYLSDEVQGDGSPTSYGWITYNPNDALRNAFFCGQPGSQTAVMSASNARSIPSDNDATAIGLIVPSWGTTMGPGNANGGFFAPTYATAVGAGPNSADVGGWDGSYFEGSLWTVQTGTDSAGQSHRYLIPNWVNPDGSTVPLQLAALPSSGALAATGDYNAYTSANDYVGNWIPVQFVIDN